MTAECKPCQETEKLKALLGSAHRWKQALELIARAKNGAERPGRLVQIARNALNTKVGEHE